MKLSFRIHLRRYDDGTEEGRPEVGRGEAQVEDIRPRHPDHQCQHGGVDHQKKQAKRQQDQREAEELEDRLGRGVGESHDDGDDQELPCLTAELEPVDQPDRGLLLRLRGAAAHPPLAASLRRRP